MSRSMCFPKAVPAGRPDGRTPDDQTPDGQTCPIKPRCRSRGPGSVPDRETAGAGPSEPRPPDAAFPPWSQAAPPGSCRPLRRYWQEVPEWVGSAFSPPPIYIQSAETIIFTAQTSKYLKQGGIYFF